MSRQIRSLAFCGLAAAFTLLGCDAQTTDPELQEAFSVLPEGIVLEVGQDLTLNVTLLRDNGRPVPQSSLRWVSTSTSATVAAGVVTARSAGETLIIASSGRYADTTHIAIVGTGEDKAMVAISPDFVTLQGIGTKTNLRMNVYDATGTLVQTMPEVAWSTVNPDIVLVDQAGSVTARALGTAMIVATLPCCNQADTAYARVQEATVLPGEMPELPRAHVDITWPGYNRIVDVAPGQSIQAALNSAQPGDFIRLQNGATYYEHIVLPVRDAGEPILIGSLPPEGRAVPGTLPKVIGRDVTKKVLSASRGAQDYRVVGVELAYDPSITSATSIVGLYDAHEVILDRIVAVGPDAMDLRRAVTMNGTHLAVIDSYLMASYKGADSQAILSHSGVGPYHIEGNYLAGAGENVMFGGASASNGMPADITIRRNHFHKPERWRTSGAGTVKNLFEIKFAERVLLEGNVFDGNWADGQDGHAFNVKLSASGDGTRISDLTIRYNILKNSEHGFKIGSSFPRVLIENNLAVNWGGRLFTVLSSRNLTIRRNTFRHSSSIIVSDGAANFGFVAEGNIWGTDGGYDVRLSDFPDMVYQDNGHIGREGSRYPAGNRFVSTESEAQFNADWTLRATSPFYGIGADIEQLKLMTAGVVR